MPQNHGTIGLETGPRPNSKYSHNWSLSKLKKVISGITLITMINAETQAFYYVKSSEEYIDKGIKGFQLWRK